MKVMRMGIVEIFRRIWLFSANKIESSESFSKQPTQLIVELNSSFLRIIVTLLLHVQILYRIFWVFVISTLKFYLFVSFVPFISYFRLLVFGRYTPLQNVWHGSKSVVIFGLIKILTHPCFHGNEAKKIKMAD